MYTSRVFRGSNFSYLERLNVECIDVYLLHNPEYFLEGAIKNYDVLEARRQYYRRIEAAFQFLEKEVEKVDSVLWDKFKYLSRG